MLDEGELSERHRRASAEGFDWDGADGEAPTPPRGQTEELKEISATLHARPTLPGYHP